MNIKCIKCIQCNKGLEIGPLYRMNPGKLPGVFQHRECGGIPEDDVVENIVNLIHNDSKSKKDAPTQ